METYGEIVEKMDLAIEDNKRDLFESVLNQYLPKDSEKTILEDVNELPEQKAIELVDKLNFHCFCYCW